MFRNILLDIPKRSLGRAPSPRPPALRSVKRAFRHGFSASVGRSFPHIRAESLGARVPAPLLRRSRRGFSFGGGDKHLYLFNLPFGDGRDRFLLHRRPIPVDKTLRTEPRRVRHQSVRVVEVNDHISARSRLGQQRAAAQTIERVVHRLNFVRQDHRTTLDKDTNRPGSGLLTINGAMHF